MAKRPQLNVRTDDDFDRMVEEIRSARRPIPSVSDLVRDLVREEYERMMKRHQRAANRG